MTEASRESVADLIHRVAFHYLEELDFTQDDPDSLSEIVQRLTDRRVVAQPADEPISMKIIADRVEEDADVSEQVDRLEAAADRDVAAGTVTLRWGREQIAVVKRAAGLMGVPDQTYMKQVVFTQALADIERAEAVLTQHH